MDPRQSFNRGQVHNGGKEDLISAIVPGLIGKLKIKGGDPMAEAGVIRQALPSGMLDDLIAVRLEPLDEQL